MITTRSDRSDSADANAVALVNHIKLKHLSDSQKQLVQSLIITSEYREFITGLDKRTINTLFSLTKPQIEAVLTTPKDARSSLCRLLDSADSSCHTFILAQTPEVHTELLKLTPKDRHYILASTEKGYLVSLIKNKQIDIVWKLSIEIRTYLINRFSSERENLLKWITDNFNFLQSLSPDRQLSIIQSASVARAYILTLKPQVKAPLLSLHAETLSHFLKLAEKPNSEELQELQTWIVKNYDFLNSLLPKPSTEEKLPEQQSAVVKLTTADRTFLMQLKPEVRDYLMNWEAESRNYVLTREQGSRDELIAWIMNHKEDLVTWGSGNAFKAEHQIFLMSANREDKAIFMKLTSGEREYFVKMGCWEKRVRFILKSVEVVRVYKQLSDQGKSTNDGTPLLQWGIYSAPAFEFRRQAVTYQYPELADFLTEFLSVVYFLESQIKRSKGLWQKKISTNIAASTEAKKLNSEEEGIIRRDSEEVRTWSALSVLSIEQMISDRLRTLILQFYHDPVKQAQYNTDEIQEEATPSASKNSLRLNHRTDDQRSSFSSNNKGSPQSLTPTHRKRPTLIAFSRTGAYPTEPGGADVNASGDVNYAIGNKFAKATYRFTLDDFIVSPSDRTFKLSSFSPDAKLSSQSVLGNILRLTVTDNLLPLDAKEIHASQLRSVEYESHVYSLRIFLRNNVESLLPKSDQPMRPVTPMDEKGKNASILHFVKKYDELSRVPSEFEFKSKFSIVFGDILNRMLHDLKIISLIHEKTIPLDIVAEEKIEPGQQKDQSTFVDKINLPTQYQALLSRELVGLEQQLDGDTHSLPCDKASSAAVDAELKEANALLATVGNKKAFTIVEKKYYDFCEHYTKELTAFLKKRNRQVARILRKHRAKTETVKDLIELLKWRPSIFSYDLSHGGISLDEINKARKSEIPGSPDFGSRVVPGSNKPKQNLFVAITTMRNSSGGALKPSVVTITEDKEPDIDVSHQQTNVRAVPASSTIGYNSSSFGTFSGMSISSATDNSDSSSSDGPSSVPSSSSVSLSHNSPDQTFFKKGSPLKSRPGSPTPKRLTLLGESETVIGMTLSLSSRTGGT